nr:hypothetical protein BSM_02560 [uncultured archaeon]
MSAVEVERTGTRDKVKNIKGLMGERFFPSQIFISKTKR